MRFSLENTGSRFPAGKLPVFLFLGTLGGYLLLHVIGGWGFCWFKALTGVNCPTCGLSRSFLALLGGNPVAALSYNPFMLLLTIAVLIQILSTLVFRKRLVLSLPPAGKKAGLVLLAALFLANWLYVILAV